MNAMSLVTRWGSAGLLLGALSLVACANADGPCVDFGCNVADSGARSDTGARADTGARTDGGIVALEGGRTDGSTTRPEASVGTDGSSGCLGGEQLCSGVCRDVSSDPNNCGACGTRCSTGQSCVTGRCSGSMMMTGGSPGTSCTSDADCGAGTCLVAASGFPGGYCLFGCTSASDCGATGLCVMSGSNTFCLGSCTTRSDCRAGYVCVSLSSGDGVCLPSCTVDPALVCGAGSCDPTSERCNYDCASARDCSTGSSCDTLSAQCVCTTRTNCGAGWRCYADGSCGCSSSAVCGPGHTCDTTTGQCN